MKRNVDLTENMMFSTKQLELSYFFKRKLIVLGSAEERNHFRRLNEAMGDSYCDRCGVEIRVVPWRKESRLCQVCETELIEKYKDRCPWREHTRDETRNTILNW